MRNKIDHITADNQLNAKPVVKQRHPGDEFPVSQRGSKKGKVNKYELSCLKAVNLNQNEYVLKYI